MPELRPYQLDAVKSIFGELHYRQSTLRVACTGSGKTHEQAAAVRIHLRRGGKCVLWVAPRNEIIQQGLETLKLWNPELAMGRDVCIEQGDHSAHLGAKVVMASIQSLSDERLDLMPTPDLIIADEAHLYFDACGRIFDKWPKAKRIGWTATPDRLDRLRLIPKRFESVAAVYELGEAIRDGSLVRPEFRQVIIEELELDGIPSKGPDFSEDALAREMTRPEVLEATVRAIGAKTGGIGGPATLVFCVSIKHAAEVAAALNDRYKWPIAKLVTGEMPRAYRASQLEGFRAQEFPIIVSVDLFTYGLDVPFVGCIVLARPTKSRALYSQMVGRGLRLHPGKETCLVLDLGANTDRHTLITPEEALRPDYDLINMTAMASFDLAPAVALEVDQGVDEDLEEDPPAREGAPEEVTRLTLSYRTVTNQLELVGIKIPLRELYDKPATALQVDILEDLGVDGADTLGMNQASKVIDLLHERRKQGFCTIRQAKTLQRFSLYPNVTFKLAGLAITAIKENGWMLPGWLIHKHPKLQHTGTETLRMKS